MNETTKKSIHSKRVLWYNKKGFFSKKGKESFLDLSSTIEV
jgi:hypothetical protein